MIRQDWSTLKKLMFMKAAAGGGSAAVERMATGNPVVFGTDLAKPLRSLLIPFTPVQSGTGDPSPSNIRPLVPWDGLSVFGGGKNLLNPVAGNIVPFVYSSFDNYTLENGIVTTSGNTLFGFKIPVKPSTYYNFSFDTSESVTLTVYRYENEPDYIRNGDTGLAYIESDSARVYSPSNCHWIVCGIYTSKAGVTIKDFQLELDQGTSYEPYEPITETEIPFASPVYGGALDVVSGVLKVEYGLVALDTIRFYSVREGFFASYANVPEYSDRTKFVCNAYKVVSFTYWDDMQDGQIMGITPGNTIRIKDESVSNETELYAKLTEMGAVLAYPLATPQEIPLTPEQITAIKGENTVWSDANGSLTAVYLVSSKYAEEHPVGGLSSGLGSGLLGSNQDPDEPIEDPEENPEE